MKSLGSFLVDAPLLNEDIRDVDNKISNYGDFEEIKGAMVIIKTILRNLLMVKETYLFDPEMGMGIQKYIFEPVDEKTYSRLQRSIAEIVTNNQRNSSDISFKLFVNSDGKGYTIQFDIVYRGKIKTFNVTLDESLLDGLDGPTSYDRISEGIVF